MQTFLPHPCFTTSARMLDNKRLGKQRVECVQILNALEGRSRGWVNHPATRMWRGYERALRKYLRACITVWVERGFRNTIPVPPLDTDAPLPPWLGDEGFHRSHRSNLKRKDPEHYAFDDVPDDLPYVWPAGGQPAFGGRLAEIDDDVALAKEVSW
jgi:hypothetical protein